MHYLLDACPLVSYYTGEDELIKARVARLFAKRIKGEAKLYVPNFCVAEAMNAIAKKCFQQHLYGTGADAVEAFGKFQRALLDDVTGGTQLYSYELSRRHIVGADHVFQNAHSISHRTGSPPSAFDILIISMALDIAKIVGKDNLTIVTAEAPIENICANFKSVYPRAVNVRSREPA